MRSGGGPAIVEAEVYRFFHQNGSYPGSAFGYRSKDEEAAWIARDPVARVAREMIALGLIDDAGVASVREQAQTAMTAAVGRLLEADPEAAGKRRIRPNSGRIPASSTWACAATPASCPAPGHWIR